MVFTLEQLDPEREIASTNIAVFPPLVFTPVAVITPDEGAF